MGTPVEMSRNGLSRAMFYITYMQAEPWQWNRGFFSPFPGDSKTCFATLTLEECVIAESGFLGSR